MLSIEQQFPIISGYGINPMTIFGIPKNHIMKTNLRVRFLGVFFVLLLGAWSANARLSLIHI